MMFRFNVAVFFIPLFATMQFCQVSVLDDPASDGSASQLVRNCAITPLADDEPCPLGQGTVLTGAKIWSLTNTQRDTLGRHDSDTANSDGYVLDAAGYIQGVTLEASLLKEQKNVRIYGYDGTTRLALISWDGAASVEFVSIDSFASEPALTAPEPFIASDDVNHVTTAIDKTPVYALKSNSEGQVQLRMIYDGYGAGTPVGVYGHYGSLILNSPWIQFMRVEHMNLQSQEAIGFLKDGCTDPSDLACICVPGTGAGPLQETAETSCDFHTIDAEGIANPGQGFVLNSNASALLVAQPANDAIAVSRLAPLSGC
ncbi:MAG: hypothetical protein IPJ88_06470 [Myxococcales bacterium]|nr:MAG: hypothetical protein IPJ88_06470 [Myxococcales bacterium]